MMPMEQPTTPAAPEETAPEKVSKAARRKQAREKNRGMLMSAVIADISKPIGCSWDELGTVLRALRSQAHRVVNDAAFADEIARRDGAGAFPQTVAYRAACWASAAFREWCRTQKKDEKLKAWGEIEPGSAILLGWASKAHDNVQRWHDDERAGRPARLPTMKKGAPIYVPRANWTLKEEEDGSLLLSVPLLAGRDRRFTMRLAAYRGDGWGALRQIASGEVEAGALQLTWDERARRKDGKKGKWTARIAYKRPRPELRQGGGTLVVHRGQRNFVWLLPSTGLSHGKPISGYNIKAQKERWEARCREVQRGSNPGEQGRGARGHGRQRRFRNIDNVRARQQEVMRTLCQQLSAEIVAMAILWGCASVAIEDYGGIGPNEERQVRRFLPRFPLYLLKQCIARACEKAGLTLVEVPSFYISTKCPRCSVVDAAAHNTRTGIFHCRACGLDEKADSVAAWHMLCAVYPNGGTPIHEARARELRLLEKLRKTEANDNEEEAPPDAAE